jgi:hypothetical protein
VPFTNTPHLFCPRLFLGLEFNAIHRLAGVPDWSVRLKDQIHVDASSRVPYRVSQNGFSGQKATAQRNNNFARKNKTAAASPISQGAKDGDRPG